MKPLKVVADTANGMGGLVVPEVFEGLPFSLTVLYGELDGTFPNHPADPIQLENLKDLQRAVLDLERRHRPRVRRRRRPRVPRRRQGRAGQRLDHDRDRRGRHPRPASGRDGRAQPHLLAGGARESSASTAARRCATRVGHSFIKQVMAETGAIFGGEHSAHYYFRDNWRADSGSIAALLVLEQLGRAGMPLSELRKPFERYVQSGEINSRVDDPLAVIETVAAEFSDAPAGPARRADRRLRRLVVQPAAEQHRAAAAPEPRSPRRGAVRGAHPRGAGAHPRQLSPAFRVARSR